MLNVLLVVHLIACISLVFAVLLQRSEGGALGMGGGGTGGLISGRGAANVLVRTTMVLAAVFFTTSVVMTRLNAEQARAPTELERQLQEQQNRDPFSSLPATPAPGTTTTPPPSTTPPVTTAPDPLAPSTPPASTTAPAPSGAATPPAQSTAPVQPAPAPAQPAQPTPDPLAPTPNP
jgi:preprotein translocase subunit SecG